MLAHRSPFAWLPPIAAAAVMLIAVASLLPTRAEERQSPLLAATADNQGDTKKTALRDWQSTRDLPQPIASDSSIKFDFPIVYVRVPRPYPKEYNGINHLNQAGLHQTNPPGAELRLLHPDGRDESLVPVEPHESITDPVVSFDGEWVYYAKFHEMRVGEAHMSRLRSRQGADIFKIHVPTRKVIQLTSQQRTPNTGALPVGTESHPRGVHNLAPCPVAGGKVVFVSDRNGYRGVREQTQPALQLHVMDDDGSNVELIAPMNLGTALHPVALKDGRVMFSSLETQGLRFGERWGIWAIRPDGTQWNPLTSAFGSPHDQGVHFQAQLSDESIVVEAYYQTGSTDGFGTYWKFPLRRPTAQPPFVSAAKQFAPYGLTDLTLFASSQDIRPNHKVGDVSNRIVVGNVTHPSAAPDNHLLTTWALPWDGQDQSEPGYDAGIYLMKSGKAINHPSKMLLIKNDPKYQELWPKALVAYRRIYGVDEPRLLVHRNDGKTSPHLPAGTPFGLVGSSSLYKRESYPGGVVPTGSVTAVSPKPNDRMQQWRELAAAGGNWRSQGADAGLYDNSDIWGVRILILEPVSEALSRKNRHFALASDAEERIRILGEFPVRKFAADGTQPTDPDGNPDTSFLAKVPADVAWTFQTLDHNGMVLNMAQTWHQVRPGEVRTDCGGCHAHSQAPTDFQLTIAAKPDSKLWDLTTEAPLFTTKAHDNSGQKWDVADRTGLRTEKGVKDVEFNRDIKPILARSCVACHSTKHDNPAGNLVLDDDRPTEKVIRVPWANHPVVPKGMPGTYARLAQYSWAFQSRRSPLIWNIYGKRLDGFANDDIPSPPFDYLSEKDVLDYSHHSKHRNFDFDYSGKTMPPAEAVAGTYETQDGSLIKVAPLSDEDKLTLVRWVDLGCPIDLAYDPERPTERGDGWFLDEGRPTLALAAPLAGSNTEPLERLLLGLHDYHTGLDIDSLSVTADFSVNGISAGQNLAASFNAKGAGVWELPLNQPIDELAAGTLTVSIKDRQGNVSRIHRTFSIDKRR